MPAAARRRALGRRRRMSQRVRQYKNVIPSLAAARRVHYCVAPPAPGGALRCIAGYGAALRREERRRARCVRRTPAPGGPFMRAKTKLTIAKRERASLPRAPLAAACRGVRTRSAAAQHAERAQGRRAAAGCARSSCAAAPHARGVFARAPPPPPQQQPWRPAPAPRPRCSRGWRNSACGAPACALRLHLRAAPDAPCFAFCVLRLFSRACVCVRSRPKNVGEVACQEEVVATLSKSIETANVRAAA